MAIDSGDLIGGGGSISNFPPRPSPLFNDGFLSTEGDRIPHKGTLIDGVKIPTGFNTGAAGSYSGMLAEVTIWTVDAADINAAADGFIGIVSCWYDSVNDRLYIFGLDIGTTPATIYTGYITLETGAVTSVGGVQLTSDPSVPSSIGIVTVSRTAIDSGNFTLFFNDRTVVIDESNGSEVSSVASVNITNGFDVGTYATLDGTITLDNIDVAADNSTHARLTRNKLSLIIPLPVVNLFCTFDVLLVRAVAWGDKVKIYRETGTGDLAILRTFDRTEFDAWLQDVANYGGLA